MAVSQDYRMAWNHGFYKLLLVGDSNVGKSEIQQKYVCRTPSSALNPTVGANIRYKSVIIDGKAVLVQIRDLAEKFQGSNSFYYKGVDGIMLIFDLTNRESFTHMQHWFQDKHLESDDVQLMLVGNKYDLSSERRVLHVEAEKEAKENGDIPYIETSAKTGLNIVEAFEVMIKSILKDPVQENMKRILQSLNRAGERGTIPVTFLKIFLTGSAAAGKTSFSHLLLKKDFNKDHESTNMVSASHAVSVQRAAFSSASIAEGDDDITWVQLDANLQIRYLGSLLVHPDPDTSEATGGHVKENDEVHGTTLVEKSIAGFWYLLIWIMHLFSYSYKETKQASNDHSKSTDASAVAINEATDFPINRQNLSCFSPILYNTLISDSGPLVHKPGEKLNIITILDTGGQPQYIHLLPTINIYPTVNFVVHDLNRDLDGQVEIKYNKNGRPVVCPYHLNYSYLDMIKLLMSAANDSVNKSTSDAQQLHLHTKKGSDDTSYVCLVGTHKDVVTDEDISKAAQSLTTLVSDMKCEVTVWPYEDGNILFAVDNTTAGSQREDPIANTIRSRIENIASTRDVHELPVTWMLLEIEIRRFCEQNKKAYISVSKCLSIAEGCGLMSSEEEVKHALEYLHILGVLLYFTEVDGLRDYIIIDHQWWFDNVSKIIDLTFEQNLSFQAGKELKSQGLLTKKLLNCIEWKGDIEKEYFISLLEHKKIIARLNEKYFIPFVLPTYDPKESDVLSHYGNIQGEPLLVQFCSGLVPRGIFCTLVVQLLQLQPSNGWNLHISPDIRHTFNNLISFSLPNGYSLSLLDKINYLEFQIRHKKRNCQNPIHYIAYRNLAKALTVVCEKLSFNAQRLQYGFLCPYKRGFGDHIAILRTSEKYATCTAETTHSVPMTPLHMLWFSEEVSATQNIVSYSTDQEVVSSTVSPDVEKDESLLNVPTMKLLHQIVITKIAFCWEVVADYLEYETEFKRLIEKERRTSTGLSGLDCCAALLEDWLSSDRGKSPKTWSTLINVLREIKSLTSATEKIAKELAERGVFV